MDSSDVVVSSSPPPPARRRWVHAAVAAGVLAGGVVLSQFMFSLKPTPVSAARLEVRPGQVGKGGIVRDAALYDLVQTRLREACAALTLQVAGWHDSPIAGGDGNREFFVHARHGA